METKTIRITGVSSTDKKVTLLDDKLKYNFWMKKKDGQDTKAFEQFQKFGFRVGDVVEAAVEEEEQSFTNEKGKNIKFTDRKIALFNVENKNTPKVIQVDEDVVPPKEDDRIGKILTNTETILKRLDEMQGTPEITGGEDEIKIEDVPF